MTISIFSTNLSETFLTRIERDDKKMYIGLRIKYPSFLSFLMKLEFSRHIFEKINKHQIL